MSVRQNHSKVSFVKTIRKPSMEHQSIFCEPMHVCIFHNEYEQLSCLSFELTTCGFISPEISSSDT